MPDVPQVTWAPFDPHSPATLIEHLGLTPPPFTTEQEVFRQLRYVAQYAADLNCRSVAIESIYIDRDYIEDHSVFYSKSLYPYKNHCTRLHFFSTGIEETQKGLENILLIGVSKNDAAYKKACKDFSEKYYLGFCVIKPLMGSPVGRTVFRSFQDIPQDPKKRNEFKRDFTCVRSYIIHFLGAALSVRGLAFQQQDVGVSACATTAIWSALQKTSEHENIAIATPAGITKLAARFSLPYGRPMPSEGLSLDQMSQVINALGVAPNVFRVKNASVGKSYLYSAIRSGFPPILILVNSDKLRHAVAVAGMKIRTDTNSTEDKYIEDPGERLIGLYIHDDRKGPYLRALLETSNADKALRLTIPGRKTGDEITVPDDEWTVSHILIPMHEKIRFSFSGLTDLAGKAADIVLRYRETFGIPTEEISNSSVRIDTRIMRAHKYIESFFDVDNIAIIPQIKKLTTEVALSRYVGLVRLRTTYSDPIDLLVDTTSTKRNVHLIGVVPVGDQNHTLYLSKWLSTHLECRLIS